MYLNILYLFSIFLILHIRRIASKVIGRALIYVLKYFIFIFNIPRFEYPSDCIGSRRTVRC
jgi:hypothetical protein